MVSAPSVSKALDIAGYGRPPRGPSGAHIVIVVVSEQRRAEVDQIQSSVTSWAKVEPSIVGVGLVGSWAWGEARIDSDIDMVLLALDVEQFVQSSAWLEPALSQPAEIVRTQSWGAD